MFSTWYKLLASRRLGRPDQKHRPVRLGFDHLENRLAPAVFTVTNLSDAVMLPARGLELRQAIALADLAANIGSTINFSVSGTIILAQGEYNITQPMTIDATGHSVAINAAAKSRGFRINTPGTVTITNLIIKNGNAGSASTDGLGNGGGIYDASSSSILNLNSDQILLNSATTATGGGNGGGVYSNGVVTLNSTLVEANTAHGGDGGGIYAAENITLNGSTVSNDTAVAGGGIYQAGTGTTATLNDSAITTNKGTAGSGGGVWAFYNVMGNASTVSNNLALGGGSGGGIFSLTGNVTDPGTISGNTATGEGGGIWAQFNVVLTSANVSNNVGNTGGGGIWSNDGFVMLSESTVSGNTAGAGTNGFNNNTGNGGGIWSATDVTIDATSTVTGNTSNGSGGGIFALRTVTINGGTVSNNTATTSIFDTNGNPLDGSGGSIYAVLDVNLNGGVVAGNTASLDGGGVYLSGGNIDVNSAALVSNNIAGADGGGIWDLGGNVSIDSSSVTTNEANHGGGVFVSGSPAELGSLSVTNSSITSNEASVEGGGIFVSIIESVTISGTTFDSNSALLNGGAMSAHGVENVAITGCTFTNNSATSGSGGAIYVIGPSDVYLSGDTFGLGTGSGNSAGVAGGAVYLQNAAGTIYACTFDNNISYGGPYGGSDLFVDSNATLDLNDSDFDDTLGVSASLRTELIDVGNTVPGGNPGVITSSGGNSVWDNSWVNITNFNFPGSGDGADDQA